MKIPYMPIAAKKPIPSLGGSMVRYRPVMAVRLTGPADTKLRDGLLDTGADDTIFTRALAVLLGVDLHKAEERQVALAGRPRPVRCQYAAVRLRVTDGAKETYEWTATVGFVSASLHYNLLGQAGFLQFFDADFRGDDHEVLLRPKLSFPGSRV